MSDVSFISPLFSLSSHNTPERTHTCTHTSGWLSLGRPNVRPYGNATAVHSQIAGTHTHGHTHTGTRTQTHAWTVTLCKLHLLNIRFKWETRREGYMNQVRVCVCVCVCVVPCQGRSTLLALDSTCCYWTHKAQLAPQCVCVCVCVCVSLPLCAGQAPSLCLSASLCIGSILLCKRMSCPPIDNYVVRQVCLSLSLSLSHTHTHTHTRRGHYEMSGGSQPITEAPGGILFHHQ